MYSVVTEPASEPITLAEAKLFLRVDGGEDDALITSLMTAARRQLEEYCFSGFVAQTWSLTLDTLLAVIEIRPGPVTAINSVQYIDQEGNLQTLSSDLYDVDLARWPVRIAQAEEAVYPTVKAQVGAVTVNFNVGYAAVPETLQTAIKIRTSDFYDQRSVFGANAPLPDHFYALLDPYRFFAG